MDMHVFQVESNKVLPQQGSILISSPFMNDYHFKEQSCFLSSIMTREVWVLS